MQKFLDSNPGFVSRFNDTIHFPDYSAEELYSIFSTIAKKSHYSIPKPVTEKIKADFTWFIENKNQNFANGRLARKYFEAIVETQANRLSKNKENTKNQLRRVTLKDLPQNLSKLI
jgi:stage V sporulation protein K